MEAGHEGQGRRRQAMLDPGLAARADHSPVNHSDSAIDDPAVEGRMLIVRTAE